MKQNVALTEQRLREKQRAQWNTSAPGWERWADWYEFASQPLIDWFVRTSPAGADVRILDVASGSGMPALALASHLRGRGVVVATDLAGEMLAVAERRARAASLDNLAFQLVDAEHLPFADASFDAVVCAFGVTFCPEPVNAVREMRRVLKPGAGLALAVWDEPSKNVFFSLLIGALAIVVSMPPPKPDAPGPFRLASPDRLTQVLHAGGMSDVAVETLQLTFRCESVDQYWQILIDGSAPVKAAVDSLSSEDLGHVRQLLLERVQPYMTDHSVRLPGAVLCASGVAATG